MASDWVSPAEHYVFGTEVGLGRLTSHCVMVPGFASRFGRCVVTRLLNVAHGRRPPAGDDQQGRSGCALAWATDHLAAEFRFSNIRTVYGPTLSAG
jgi:hypothetical protein